MLDQIKLNIINEKDPQELKYILDKEYFRIDSIGDLQLVQGAEQDYYTQKERFENYPAYAEYVKYEKSVDYNQDELYLN